MRTNSPEVAIPNICTVITPYLEALDKECSRRLEHDAQ